MPLHAGYMKVPYTRGFMVTIFVIKLNCQGFDDYW